MCGICGILTRGNISGTDILNVEKMNDALIHRGPDGSGEYRDARIAMAMRRLSIIDLENGWQPLYSEDKSLVLIANGEIYNYIELREKLKAKGHQFQSEGDCETIIHLFEEYGTDCVNHLRGMFAFALWDKQRQRLFLARDRLGEKPLYLYENRGRLFFASEMKALLSSGAVPFEIDPSSINLYFHYQYVPEPASPIRGVRKLGPGRILIASAQTWAIDEKQYWSFEDIPPIEGVPSEVIRNELETVSEITVRSDVPVGVALSGGLDSSAIAALAQKKYPNTMHAFCIGYSGRPVNDERAQAKELADHLNMPFHDVELSESDMVSFFPELTYWRDDPIADISGYGYYAVMKLASEFNVSVMLQGQGGDELFWGYPWVKQAVWESFKKKETVVGSRRAFYEYLFLRPLTEEKSGMFKKAAANALGLSGGVRRLLRDVFSPPDRMVFYDLTPDFTETLRVHFFTPSFAARLERNEPYELFTAKQPWERVDLMLTDLICRTYLLGNGIAQGDRLSMASSVELRLPLLDFRFVETVLGLRKSHPDHLRPPKSRFIDALRGVLPDWVLNRPKRGFTPPVHLWHKALFKKYAADLSDGYLTEQGIIKPEYAKVFALGALPSYCASPLSFKALVLEFWCREMSALCR